MASTRRYPLYNKFLQSNLAGAGRKIDDLAGLEVGYKTVRECYIGERIAVWGSVPTGSGSYDDPWDVSTAAKFNAVMSDTSKAARANTMIGVRYGEFLHSGGNAWYLRSGCHLVGEGYGQVSLKIAPGTVVPVSGLNCISSDHTVANTGIRVAGIKVDPNYANLDNTAVGKVNGVILYGNHPIIEQVQLLPCFGDFATLRESFGLFCEGKQGDTTSFGAKIRDCIVEGYLGNYGGGIVITGPSGTPCTGGVISGNRISGYKPVNGLMTGQHVGAIGCLGGTIENNEITDSQVAIYNEQGSDVKIAFNTMRDIWESAIHLNPAALIKRVRIVGNSIEMRDDGDTYQWVILASDFNDGTREVHNLLIQGNSIIRKLTGNPYIATGGAVGIFLTVGVLNRGHIVVNNQIDAWFSNNIYPPDAYVLGNRDLTGDVIATLPDTIETTVSDTAYASSWNGVTTLAPSKNALWDRLNVMEKTTSFTPTTAGWYRILTGVDSAAGKMRVKGIYGSGISDLEFAFDVNGYGLGVGTVQQLRAQYAILPIVDKVQLSSNGLGAVYLDLHVAYVTTPGPIYVYVDGPNLPELVVAPVVGAVVGGTDPLEFTFTRGFDSSYGTVFDRPVMFVDAGSGSDTLGTGLSASSAVETIQEALDRAVDGTEIIVGEGIYDEEVTVKAGTYVITLQHGAIWKQTDEAKACLLSADVTCDFTINGNLYTEPLGGSTGGATCVAMPSPCPNCTIRINGDLIASGGGIAYTEPSALYQIDGFFHMEGNIVASAAGIVSDTSSATAMIDMVGDITAVGRAVKLLGNGGTAAFKNGRIKSTTSAALLEIEERSLDFTRCTLEAVLTTGVIVLVSGGGTGIVTLHEFCHLLAGSTATELSDSLTELVLDGISFTNKPKEAGTTLSGDGYLFEGGAAQTGTVALV